VHEVEAFEKLVPALGKLSDLVQVPDFIEKIGRHGIYSFTSSRRRAP
jgi:hypothetical protein